MKLLALTTAFLALAGAVTIALAQDEPAPEPKPQPAPKELTQAEKDALATRAYFVLRNRCWGCHGEPGKTAYGETVALDWILDYDKLVEAKLVIPGKVKESRLIYLTTLGKMPREFDENGKPSKEGELPEAEQKALIEWVKAGAPKWPKIEYEMEWVPVGGPKLDIQFDLNTTPYVRDFGLVRGAPIVLVRERIHPRDQVRVLKQAKLGWEQVGTPLALGLGDDALLLSGELVAVVRTKSTNIARESETTLIDEWDGKAWVSIVSDDEPKPATTGALARLDGGAIRMLCPPAAPGQPSVLWELRDKKWKCISDAVAAPRVVALVPGIGGTCRGVGYMCDIYEIDVEGRCTVLRSDSYRSLLDGCWQGGGAGALIAREHPMGGEKSPIPAFHQYIEGKWRPFSVTPSPYVHEALLSWDETGRCLTSLFQDDGPAGRRTIWALIPWRKAR